jgi:hypothetical protein
VAALACAWFLCPIPPRHPLPAPAIPVVGIGYICAVALAAILTGWLFHAPFSTLVKSAAAALWCAPLVVLAVQGSPLTAIPLIFLVVLATPLFGLGRGAIAPSKDDRLLRQFPSSMIAAAAIQLAAIEALLRHQNIAGVLFSAGGAVIAWRATAVDPRGRPRSGRVAAMAVLAAVLVLLGMLPFQAPPRTSTVAGNGGADSAGAEAGDGVTADSYRGVILLPEIQHKVTLVPPLPALINNPFRENKKDLEIPFYGVYWFFRQPYTHPPKDSIEMHGKPSELTFRSHDSRPLIMEAHQSLGAPFQVSCCGSIQLAITNRNRAAGSVSIELLLVDTFSDAKPSQSLGMRPVQSAFGANELLDYPIPPSPAISEFDEFTIRFHRPFMLARESPNVSIDGFTLKPR